MQWNLQMSKYNAFGDIDICMLLLPRIRIFTLIPGYLFNPIPRPPPFFSRIDCIYVGASFQWWASLIETLTPVVFAMDTLTVQKIQRMKKFVTIKVHLLYICNLIR
jgi:hypothetical protein